MKTTKKKKQIAGSIFPISAIPKRGTLAAQNYFLTYQSLYRFSSWVLFMAAQMDTMREKAHSALLDLEECDEPTREVKNKEFKNQKTMIDELKRNRQVFLEIQLTRHIDNFLNYLAELLSEIFTQRPETLRSSDQIELADVLRHESIASLVKSVSERQVEKLSYNSFSDLSDFFMKRFNIELFPSQLNSTVVEAIELRNLSTHNRCVVNQRFCKRTGTDISQIGKKRELSIKDLDRIVPVLAQAVIRIDKDVKHRLSLKGILFKKLSATA